MHIASILRFRFLFFLMLLAAHLGALAQVRFNAIASSKQLGRSDYFQLEFVVENAKQIENLNQPELRDFQIVSGPNQSTGMTIVNGNVSQYKSLSFILQPLKTGKFTIPGATAIIDGKKMQSNSITIHVDPGGSSASHFQPMPMPTSAWPGEDPEYEKDYVLKPGDDINEKIRKNLFVKVLLSKTSCYVGEPIVATYKLYSRLQSESRVTRHPSLNGFSVYDMVDPTADNSSIESVNGKPFSVHIIRKAQLIPLQAGNINLDPVELDNTVHFVKTDGHKHKRSNNPMQELFDRFSGTGDTEGERVDQRVTLESKPVEISVKALPLENRPADFNGAVGHFSIAAKIESRNVVTQDAAILKLTVKGTGNLPVVNAPTVNWPSGIESYAASAKEEIDKTVAPMNGSKTFEYKFVPSHPGSFQIPAIDFSYFDPTTGLYKSLESQPLSLNVAAGEVHKSSAPASTEKSASSAMGLVKRFFNDHLEWIFGSLILSSLAIFLVVQTNRAKKINLKAKSAAEAARQAELEALLAAPKPKTDPLLTSRTLLESGNYRSFYTELNRAIWNEAADKLRIRSSELNKQNIVHGLAAIGWTTEETGLLQNTLSECEVKLYTPDIKASDLERILGDAEVIMSLLEK